MSQFIKHLLCRSTFPGTRTQHWNIAEDAAINKINDYPDFHWDYPTDRYWYREKEKKSKLPCFLYWLLGKNENKYDVNVFNASNL